MEYYNILFLHVYKQFYINYITYFKELKEYYIFKKLNDNKIYYLDKKNNLMLKKIKKIMS